MAWFLFQYHITPDTTTGISPAELLMRHRPHSHLDLMHPMLEHRVTANQSRQMAGHNLHSKERSFGEGDRVYICNFSTGPKWLPPVVTSVRGPLSYEVTLLDDRVVCRHVDHARRRSDSTPSSMNPSDLCLPKLIGEPPTATESTATESPLTAPLQRSSQVRTTPERFDSCLN